MKAEKIFLENFRNYDYASVSFSDGINIIHGKNGAGKTNLIEALYTFSYARSFRAPAKECLSYGKERAKLALMFEAEGRKQTADMILYKDNKKRIRVNEIDIKKTSSLLGRFICVLFTPDEMNLVKGGPEYRRKLLDTSITAIKPGYFSALSSYLTCVKQKNALLRAENYALLDVWNDKLAEYGAKIAMTREKYIEMTAEKAKKAHSDISGGTEELEVIYSHSYKTGKNESDTAGLLREKLEEAKEREKERRVCLAGPHRDDITFKINDRSARHFASQGQNRSIVLSLKTAQMEIISEVSGEYPLLLLDDVLSELDKDRRDFFTDKIRDRQVIITCTDTDNIKIARSARLIKVDDGRICM